MSILHFHQIRNIFPDIILLFGGRGWFVKTGIAGREEGLRVGKQGLRVERQGLRVRKQELRVSTAFMLCLFLLSESLRLNSSVSERNHRKLLGLLLLPTVTHEDISVGMPDFWRINRTFFRFVFNSKRKPEIIAVGIACIIGEPPQNPENRLPHCRYSEIFTVVLFKKKMFPLKMVVSNSIHQKSIGISISSGSSPDSSRTFLSCPSMSRESSFSSSRRIGLKNSLASSSTS